MNARLLVLTIVAAATGGIAVQACGSNADTARAPGDQEPDSGADDGTATDAASADSTAPDAAAPNAACDAGATCDAGDGFTHPGILVGAAQLDYVKAKLAAGQDPWKTAYGRMMSTKASFGSSDGTLLSSLSYEPHPVATVNCISGPASGQPAPCNDETNDAIAAYVDALLWKYDYGTGGNGKAYAQKSIEILNAWAHTLTGHTGNNAALQASWAGSVFAKAAEIVRYTYMPGVGQTPLNVAQVSSMFDTAYLPIVNQTWPGGGANWIMSMTEATMNIGVFTDNRSVYDDALARWRAQAPAVSFVTSDGAQPVVPPDTNIKTSWIPAYWYNPSTYPNGLEGETCRDPAHMAMGYGAMMNVAETARLQGDDLYGEQQGRIVAGLERNTGYITTFLAGSTPTDWPCPNAMDAVNNATWKVTFEIAYNHYAVRKGQSMPNTWALISGYNRPSSFDSFAGMNFEELTSAGVP